MNTKDIEVAIYIIEKSAVYKCDQITYKTVDDGLEVRSTGSSFSASELVSVLDTVFSAYLTIRDNEVVLRVY